MCYEKYLAIKEQKNGLGDSFVEPYESLSIANENAKYGWNHLTNSEQGKYHVYVAEITETDIYQDAIENGEVTDWTAYKQYKIPENGFDSDVYK